MSPATAVPTSHTALMNEQRFVITGIDPQVADALRVRGGPISVADEHPGYPCRQCMLDAAVGDELFLVSHDPFETDSPYRTAGPIFLHRHACTDGAQPAKAGEASLPLQLTVRQLSVRAFDDTEMMVDAALIEGSALASTISRLFSDRSVHHLHVHNAARGCWAARVDSVG
jgi:hypothetical protein